VEKNSAPAQDPSRSTNFTFGADPHGALSNGAHVRRVHPRDAFGFNSKLIDRRRITRRGLPNGPFASDGEGATDQEDRGVIFMALNTPFLCGTCRTLSNCAAATISFFPASPLSE
jgi:deferrochelatase/peroxidase EfeB